MSGDLLRPTAINEPPEQQLAEVRTEHEPYSSSLARLDRLLTAYPKGADVLLYPPLGERLSDRDYSRFVTLVELILAQIKLSNWLGLVHVRDFALAEIALERLSFAKCRIGVVAASTHLHAYFEAGLRREGLADHEIRQEVLSLAQQYLNSYRKRRELMIRFHLPDLEDTEAEAIRSRLSELKKMEDRERAQEKRRDRAFKCLEGISKSDAQRMREIAHDQKGDRLPRSEPNLPPALTQVV